ncbi:hypothetical protein GCM10020358_84990 [Amorphoplanes nipponensis]
MRDEQDIKVETLIEDFLGARAVRKPSEHTLMAYRRDLTTVLKLIGDDVTLRDLSPKALRAAFAAFAAGRAPRLGLPVLVELELVLRFPGGGRRGRRQSDVGGGQAADGGPLPQAVAR